MNIFNHSTGYISSIWELYYIKAQSRLIRLIKTGRKPTKILETATTCVTDCDNIKMKQCLPIKPFSCTCCWLCWSKVRLLSGGVTYRLQWKKINQWHIYLSIYLASKILTHREGICKTGNISGPDDQWDVI